MTATVPRCFVIGPIGAEGSAVRRKADWVLHGLIKPVLEHTMFGYEVKRADQDPNPGSISDAMINDIFESDLVVADLTGFNPNAFYELGIRHAFQKPAIHIIAERGVKPPFDNQDQRTIEVDFDDFHHVEMAKQAFIAAVTYVRGDNFRVSNPVTRARGLAELIVSGDPKDRLVAKLKSELNVMSGRLEKLEIANTPIYRPKKLNSVTNDSIARERYAKYHEFIREASYRNLQVPFPQIVLDAAIGIESASDFQDWYEAYLNGPNSSWLNGLEKLDDKSFENFSTNKDLLNLLTGAQMSRVISEMRRRKSEKNKMEQ